MSVEVRYEGRTIRLASGDTVLDALERAGIAVPSSCRAGVCQSCIMRVVEGPVPSRSQEGLKDSLKQSGHFLACVGRPDRSFTCEPANVAAFRGRVAIQEIRTIGPEIVRVRIGRPKDLDFVSGQFVTLQRDDGLGRSYSIASRADQSDYFDVHVRLIPKGRMNGWLHGEARPGDVLWAEGPKGDCTYYQGNREEPLYLVGTGTGMAPLFSIAEDAVRHGHMGLITIYQGGLTEDRLYLVDEFYGLASLSPSVRYIRCVLHGSAADDVVVGDLKEVVLRDASMAKDSRVYLCGDPGIVRDLKRRLFLRGTSLKKIHADPFIGTDL